MLSKNFMCSYDEAGSIGKRYRRQDAIGTPFQLLLMIILLIIILLLLEIEIQWNKLHWN